MSDKSKNISKYIAILSATVVIIVSAFMILNYVQISTNNPIESSLIDNLVKKLETSDNDQALREEIRLVDLMSRKVYFSYIWQIESGAWIILAFGLVFLTSLKIYTKKETIEVVQQSKQKHFWEIKSDERKWLIVGVGILASSALVLSFLSEKYYSDFGTYAEEKFSDNLPLEINDKDSKSATADSNQIVTDTIENSGTDESASDSIQLPDYPSDNEIKRNHPGFRGPFGLGVNYKTKLPTEWDGPTGKNIKWKKALPLPGLNSPVLWGNYLFIAGANANTRKVYCYNRLSGALIWTKELKNIAGSPSKAPKVTNDTGYSASGLTTDGKRVYAIFATGDIIAIDFEGNQIWAKNVGVPDNHYGHSSSLQFYKDKLIVQYDDNKSCKLIALSTHTGAEVWKTKREGQISWSSPIIVSKANSAEIIVNNLPYVASYDAETGKQKWKLSCLSGEIGPSPAYGNGMVFVANEYAKMIGIKDGKKVWENYDYLPDVSSPVAYKEYVFFTTSYGDMVCINQKDGALLWHHEFDNGFYGSPVIADGKLYSIDRTGKTIIVDAAPKFKLVGEPILGEKSDCTPAFADGMIYIRGVNNLFCIALK